VIKRSREPAKEKNPTDRSVVTGDIRGFSISNSKGVVGRDQRLETKEFSESAIYTAGLQPSVSYRPVPRLVALFARGARCAVNPRAPRTWPGATTGFSYAVILRAPMERVNPHDNGNRGDFQRRFWRIGGRTGKSPRRHVRKRWLSAGQWRISSRVRWSGSFPRRWRVLRWM
jgi:hypothetical protein